MNRTVAALLTGIFVSSIALAQNTTPAAAPAAAPAPAPVTKTEQKKAKQDMVQSTTSAAVDTTGASATSKQQAKNTKASKKVAKPTKQQRAADTKAAAVYPQSGPASAAQAAKNTEVSKDTPKQPANLGTPAAEKAMEKAAKP